MKKKRGTTDPLPSICVTFKINLLPYKPPKNITSISN
jgi:hypothetical protein